MENETELERKAVPVEAEKPKVDPIREKLVTEWQGRIDAAAKHHEKAFKQMDLCMKIAAQGTSDDSWAENNITIPILTRHINLSVAQLYARHPKALAKRKEKMLFKLWDGKTATATAALQAVQAGDLSQLPMIEDILQAQQYMMLMDRIAKTLGIAWQYFMDEQEYDYKAQLKAMVRRTKVCGVAYVKLGFQRLLEPNPDTMASIADVTTKIASIDRMMNEVGRLTDEESAQLEELRLNMQDLQRDADVIVREGPVLSFPRSKGVLIDPECKHLKTFAGARWIAEPMDMDADQIKEVYGVDIGEHYRKYKEKKDDQKPGCEKAKVWVIQDRKHRQTLTICEGWPDFLREPATPDVNIERFFTIFPLVFNEVESETMLYPPSDVWMARHSQDEINRSRQGLRDHRIANRPWYAVRKGALSDQDAKRLGDHAAHEVLQFDGLGAGDKIEGLVQRGVAVAIDPAQYDTEAHYNDILRVVGSQEANFGPTTGATATETSIAENSRQSSQSDNVDDLDDLLTNLAKAGSQLMLAELSMETVLEIAGPGAAWPETPEKRSELARDLYLEIEAGSSGRPNRAAELADIERAAPTIVQLPGINPEPFAKKYMTLLNVDLEEGYIEGLPSIVALNQMVAKANAVQPGTGDPATDPAQQGGQGANNAPQPGGNQNQGQPAYPAPAAGTAPAPNQI